jgi:trehalose monomycolate/heme transporter
MTTRPKAMNAMTSPASHAKPASRSVFERWGRTAYRRRRLILLIALLVAVLGGVWGTTVFAKVQTAGGFNAPDSQSQHEANLAAQAFGRDAGDVVVLYSSPTLTTASPAFRSAVTSTLAALPHSRVAAYASYWSTGSRQFVSASGHQTYAVIELAGATDTARQDSYDAIKTDLSAAGLRTQVGGVVPTDVAIDTQTTTSITRAEGLSFPILLILLLVTFGSLTAACMPLAIGALGILGSFTALRLLTLFTGVSVFSLNITTILGLGLGIDYGLFLVTRFREELHQPGTVEDAVARTVATAGRTVLVSGVTVAIVLSSLMLFPETILRSIGYGGVATVLVDMLAALTVLPALLAVLGPKVNSLRIRRSVQRPPAAEASGGWYRLAHSVMRRPVLYAVPIVLVLLGLGSPFLHVVWGGVDATALPASAAPRLVTDALNTGFPGNPTAPIETIVQFPGAIASSPARAAGLTAYVSRLDHLPGITAAQVTGIRGDIARVDMTYVPGPYTPQARSIAGTVRDVVTPPGATSSTGGQTAALADELSSLGQTLPWMALTLVLATFLLLFLAFGSLILPLQAIVMNILSLSAMYGVVTWIFQDGHLSRLLGFTPNGTISPTIPILMFAIMFGLSMDYEVFLLSRIRERYDITGDNTTAIASGLQRTGGVITSAALLLIIVIGLFSLSSITFIKMLGVGMIVALILDATLVRMLLVPATLRLLGPASWWAPRPLRRFYARYGLHEDDGPAPGAVQAPAPALSRSVPSDTRAEPRSSTIPRAGTADSNGGMQI